MFVRLPALDEHWTNTQNRFIMEVTMKIKRLFWPVLLMALALPASAQTTEEAGTSVFAPFVSRLQGELRGSFIGLSWEDSAVARGRVHIYRSTTPFERAGMLRPELRIAELPYGAQSHVDEIEAGAADITFYYFIVASDQAGWLFDIPITHINTIGVRVPGIAPPVLPPAPALTEVSPVIITEAIPPVIPGIIPHGISSLRAVPDRDRVIITFHQSPGTSAAVLYRSVHPIRQTSDLAGAVIIQTGVRSPFTDYPVPGIPYYYAVILEEDLFRGTVEIILGHNATPAAAEVAAVDPALRRRMRPMPLPLLSIQGATTIFGIHATLPPVQELSTEAVKALEDVPPRPAPEIVLKSPRVFARDLEVSHVLGEDFALSAIVTGPFAAQNWQAARDELIGFLSLPRSPEAQARARFYLGQSYYFLHRPREGLLEFLAIQELHPAEAMAWIQAALNMLKER